MQCSRYKISSLELICKQSSCGWLNQKDAFEVVFPKIENASQTHSRAMGKMMINRWQLDFMPRQTASDRAKS